MTADIANPDAIGYKPDAGETTTPQTAPRARANFKLPTWDECDAAVKAGRASALQYFIHNHPRTPLDAVWRESLAAALAEVKNEGAEHDVRDVYKFVYDAALSAVQNATSGWQLRDTYRGTPGTRPWFWWYRAGVPPTMDDAWIDGDGKIASKGDGFGYRYSHVLPVERPVTVPGE